MEIKSCKLIPLVGVEWDGVALHLGCDREEAAALLGAAEEIRGCRCYYRGGELALDFDGEGRLEFIEFLGGPEGELRPELYGKDVFDCDADELLELLVGRNGPDVNDNEAPYCYALRRLSVGLYREVAPEDIDAMLREMCRMDLTRVGEIGMDMEAEQHKAHRWATVGIGKENYYV